jgi:hypothetical protein
VRARGGGGAEERIELGLELESDSGAGEEKGLTGCNALKISSLNYAIGCSN